MRKGPVAISSKECNASTSEIHFSFTHLDLLGKTCLLSQYKRKYICSLSPLAVAESGLKVLLANRMKPVNEVS